VSGEVGDALATIARARDTLSQFLARDHAYPEEIDRVIDHLRSVRHVAFSDLTHVGPPYYSLADLAAELEARGLLHHLDEQLAKPMLGNSRFAVGRARSRVRWLESSLAVARTRLADLEAREDAA
jgi:hypothetical protein